MTRRLALLVASSGSKEGNLPPLSTPKNDVERLAEVLQDPRIGRFDDVQKVIDGTEREVSRKIARFFINKEPDDLVLFYFSGHGVLDDRDWLHFVMSDTENDILSATSIPASFLRDEVNKCRSRRRVLILDCCYSGAFNRGHFGSKSDDATKVNIGVQFDVGGHGWFLMTASDALQMAFEGHVLDEKITNSIFSHFILQGLTSGEADRNRDGVISIDELYDYVYDQMSELKLDKKQTPCKFTDSLKGRIIIAHNQNAELSAQSPDTGSVWDQVYRKHFGAVGVETPFRDIIENSLAAYKELYWINWLRGNLPKDRVGLFDHDLSFYMAGWLKDNLHNVTVGRLAQSQVAEEITRNILSPWIPASDPDPVYTMLVEQTYRRHFEYVNEAAPLLYIYQQAAKVYDDISLMNRNTKRWKKLYELDHKLIFYIAGWIKDNITHPKVSDMSQKELAGRITDKIIVNLQTSKDLNARAYANKHFTSLDLWDLDDPD